MIPHNHQTMMEAVTVDMQLNLELKTYKEKVKGHLTHSQEKMNSHMPRKMSIMEPDNHQDLNLCCIIIKETLIKTQQKIQILEVVILGKVY